MKTSRLISLLASALVLLGASTANAMQVDTSGLATMKVESGGALGDLHWPGVHLKLGVGYNKQPTREIVAGDDVRVDAQVEMFMDKPGLGSLTRISTKEDGTHLLEHVELTIDGDKPELHVTSRSSVRVDLVTRIDSGLERAKSVPIYAYRQDDTHVVLVVQGPGFSISKGTDDDACNSVGTPEPRSHRACVFSALNWKDTAVEITLGPEQRVGQVRGDIVFGTTPKGETNEPHSFIVNASFSKVGRDVAPVLSLTTRVRETPPSMGNDEGE